MTFYLRNRSTGATILSGDPGGSIYQLLAKATAFSYTARTGQSAELANWVAAHAQPTDLVAQSFQRLTAVTVPSADDIQTLLAALHDADLDDLWDQAAVLYGGQFTNTPSTGGFRHGATFSPRGKIRIRGWSNLVADMSGWNATRFTFIECRFDSTIMDRANFSGARFVNCTFSGCSAKGAFFSQARLYGCTFKLGAPIRRTTRNDLYQTAVRDFLPDGTGAASQFRDSVWRQAKINDAIIEDTDLSGAILHGASLKTVGISRCLLQDANLISAAFINCRFRLTDLKAGSLNLPSMRGTDFFGNSYIAAPRPNMAALQVIKRAPGHLYSLSPPPQKDAIQSLLCGAVAVALAAFLVHTLVLWMSESNDAAFTLSGIAGVVVASAGFQARTSSGIGTAIWRWFDVIREDISDGEYCGRHIRNIFSTFIGGDGQRSRLRALLKKRERDGF